ncbi:hypothetical protein GCM10027294_12250 [Marinactinospora endophytica]
MGAEPLPRLESQCFSGVDVAEFAAAVGDVAVHQRDPLLAFQVGEGAAGFAVAHLGFLGFAPLKVHREQRFHGLHDPEFVPGGRPQRLGVEEARGGEVNAFLPHQAPAKADGHVGLRGLGPQASAEARTRRWVSSHISRFWRRADQLASASHSSHAALCRAMA